MPNKTENNDTSSAKGPHLWEIKAVQDLFLLLGITLLIWVLSQLSFVVVPLISGLLLAYLFNPLLAWTESKIHIPKFLTIVLVFLITLGILTAGGIWLAPIVKKQALDLMEKAPVYLDQFSNKYNFQLDDLTGRLKPSPDGSGPGPIIQMAQSIVGKTTEILFWIVLIPLYFAFFSWHFQDILKKGEQFLPLERHKKARDILIRMDHAVGTFFRARLIISILVGVIFCVGWWLAQVPFWFLLGALTGLFSVVPYLSTVGWCFALLFKYLETISQGGGFDFMAVLFWPSVVFGIGNFFEMWVFTPLIHGRTTQLNPVIILTLVLIGGSLAGFWGLLLSIPLAICLNILLIEFKLPHFGE